MTSQRTVIGKERDDRKKKAESGFSSLCFEVFTATATAVNGYASEVGILRRHDETCEHFLEFSVVFCCSVVFNKIPDGKMD